MAIEGPAGNGIQSSLDLVLTRRYEQTQALSKLLFDVLKSEFGTVLADSRDKDFSGDGATIFTLVTIDENGLKAPVLVKAAWGEFSPSSFDDSLPRPKIYQQNLGASSSNFRDETIKSYGDVVSVAKQLGPITLYCVRQSRSYFAEGDTKRMMVENPSQYLAKNAMFAVSAGKARVAQRNDAMGRSQTLEIEPPVSYENALAIAGQIQSDQK
jgi:hypothetical protein